MHTNIHFELHVTNFCSIMSILLFPESYNPNQSMHMIILFLNIKMIQKKTFLNVLLYCLLCCNYRKDNGRTSNCMQLLS